MTGPREIALCVALAALAACGSDGPSNPNPATLAGMVVLQDAWGNRMTDFSGVDVSVDGVSAHATTDISGAWKIDGVPSGQHDIRFTKSTFATMRIPSQTVAAPETQTPLITLAQAPFQQAVIDSIHVVTRSGSDVYLVDGHLSAAPPANSKLGGTVALFGKTNGVSTDVASFVVWADGIDITGKSSTFSISLPSTTARSAFAPGEQMYVTAYAISVICGCYTDPATKRPVYTTAGPRSNVVATTVK
jgi:hypothetical protein